MDRWLRVGLSFYCALALVAWVWRSGFAGQPLLFASPEAAAEGVHLAADTVSGLAAGLALIAVSRLLTRASRAGRALAHELARVLGGLEGRHAVVLALASGIGEELFFRGALQPQVGLVLASVLFGLAHLLPSWPLALWSLFAAAGGLLFGALFEITGNLVAPVVAHVLVNAVNLRWLVQRYAPEGPRS